jgi:type I restriction-modification system DNA methylase subunit
MALFQKSVLRKFLNDLDKPKLHEAWELFKSHFHNSDVQKHIRDSKEEEYQEGFVRDLFVNVLGYTLKPQPNYNLVLEKKTEADATKSDGAILRGEAVTGVIELKDTDTTELDSIEKQVFGYKHKHKNCVYVITSNFEKLRFYINDSIEYEEFDLFNLTEEGFAVLYLCLQQKNIENDIPLKIKQASVAEEEGVTKKLYAEYSTFRQRLYTNIAALNPRHNKLEIFQKTQKLLDRFLFILFAEDRLLVPPNSVRVILEDWEKLKDLDHYVPLYERFKKYFGYLNKGHAGKHYDIYAYNGGLFADDEILDNIKVDDKLLYEGAKALSNYDFQSEVDVNILGHIFEHSLSEIEEVQAELEGKAVEKTKTKRKKDGIFYTPHYITKYIVENTIGELCRQKKEELKITDDEFAYRKRRDARENKLKKLDNYRKWLLELTICDPACGSGAFLNQALEFLIAEHKYIDELRARLLGEKMVMNDMETEILSHNLFGVDINEEAVEIARLSLWLRTAQKGRKLSDLSKNIKCGNSLIDDPAVAGDKAFDWKEEFPEIFDEGGFDAVIGNPPYGASVNKIEKEFYTNNYKTTLVNYDTYALFFEKGISILKQSSLLGYITPNTFFVLENGEKLRSYLFQKNSLKSLLEIFNVFSDAVVEPIVTIIQKETPNSSNKFKSLLLPRSENTIADSKFNFDSIEFTQSDLLERVDLIFNYHATETKRKLSKKIERHSIKLGEISKITAGVKPYEKGKGIPQQTKEVVDNKPFTKYNVSELGWSKLIRGTQVNRYTLIWDGEFIKYGENLAAPRKSESFSNPKIFIRRTDDKILSVYDENAFIGLNSVHCLQLNNEETNLLTILSILNSRLMNWFFQFQNFHMVGKPLAEVKVVFIERLPIIIPSNQQPFIEKADIMLSKNKELHEAKKQLLQLLTSKYDGLTVSKKLEDWPSLSFKDFLKELTKQKIKLSLAEQTEWMHHFENEKAKANAIQQVIDTTDKKIDQMVYNLYGLTAEDIKIVEGN